CFGQAVIDCAINDRSCSLHPLLIGYARWPFQLIEQSLLFGIRRSLLAHVFGGLCSFSFGHSFITIRCARQKVVNFQVHGSLSRQSVPFSLERCTEPSDFTDGLRCLFQSCLHSSNWR